jgi:hypothetical protein
MNVRHLVLFAIIFLTASPIWAQKNRVAAQIISTDSFTVEATISICTTDTGLLQKQLTDITGFFLFSKVKDGHYLLQVEAIGFTTMVVPFNMQRGKQSLPAKLLLATAFNDLQSVVVTTKKPTVVVKKDTTEYNVASVKTGRDATVEDIFQKLPGVEVSKNGTIKAQGETITQIFVDGKPFFGTDIKAVTQNFPADMIEKIQVIDKRSDQAIAGNIDDGNYEKIINITLKKNRQKGLFGNNTIGYGTSQRYEAKANANYLNYDTKLSLIAGAANTGINSNGVQDANAPGGLNNSQVKISYTAKPGRKLDISTWAGFEQQHNKVEQEIYRRNVYADPFTRYTENNHSNNRFKSINAGLYLEYKPDSFSVIKINEYAGYSKNVFVNAAAFETLLAQSDHTLNKGNSTSSSNTSTPWVNGNASYIRRLGYNGRNLSIDLSNRINSYDARVYNVFNNIYYPADSSYSLLQNRYQYQQNSNNAFRASAVYCEPLAAKSTLSFGYAWDYNNSDLPKEVYEYNATTGLYDSILTAFSNHFKNNSQSGTASVTYNFKTKNTGFSVGARWKNAAINSSNTFDKDSSYNRSFNGLLPNLGFYKTGKRFRLNLDYNMYIRAPEALQLQPVIDNSNPLYLRLGNPGLKYAVVQTLQYKLNWYNGRKETGINARASFSVLSNNISNDLQYDAATGRQVSTPVNIQGAYNWNAWCTYYKPIYIGDDKIKWNINLSGTGYNNSNFLNGAVNITSYSMMKIFTCFYYDTPGWINLRTNFSFTSQTNRYSLQNNLNAAATYITINPVIALRPAKNTEINLDYDHRQVNSDASTLNSDANLFNASIKQYIGEQKAVAVSLKAFDILNENNNILWSYGDNYVQETQLNTLTRFLLLSISFRLQHFN